MQQTQLKFISDELLESHARVVIDKAKTAAATEDIYRNVIDPFSAAFDAAWQEIDFTDWLVQERSRQIQKALQNFVGDFHQSVLGSIMGWENLTVGNSIDLRSREKKIIAEVKNKHNTMNSGNALAVYDKLQKHLDYDESYYGYTAYCVVIIPKRPIPMNKPFHPSERGTRRPIRDDLKMIDGRSFYEIVTGDPHALQALYERLPFILEKITGISAQEFSSSGSFSELFKKAYIEK